MTDLKISVVIGVYNAEKFLRKAVSSAEELPEVEEIILIEDCSTDDTYRVCQQLEKESAKVRLFQHPEKVNRGVAASKNFGVKKAKCELIAFLDADDYYLPNRFEAEKRLFPKNPKVDGVYGALGFHYYSDKLENKYKDHFFGELTTVTGNVPPDQLKYQLIGMCREDKGYFSLVTLT
ncbi:MAG: glycosyltransferase family A protein, partial [bacterium]